MRAVNLLPSDEAASRSRPPAGPILLVVLLLGIVAALIAGAYVLERGKVVDRQRELGALQSQLRVTPRPQPEQPENTALHDEKSKRIVALSEALSNRVAFDRVLRQLALVLPEDVWLASLQASSPTAAPPGAAPGPAAPASQPAPGTTGTTGATAAPAASSTPPAGGAAPTTTFKVTGYTYAQEGVARLLARLSVVPALENVRLEKSTLDESRARPVVEFSIVADIRAPQEAA